MNSSMNKPSAAKRKYSSNEVLRCRSGTTAKIDKEFAIDRLNTHNSIESGDLTILQSSKILNAKEKIDQEGISTSQNDL